MPTRALLLAASALLLLLLSGGAAHGDRSLQRSWDGGVSPQKPGLGGVRGTGVSRKELRRVRSHIYSGKRVRKGRYEATSYGPPWNALQGSGITSTGIRLGKGVRRYLVAIDPQWNNYGRFVWIWPNPFRWRGPFLTADTGGAIRGKRIDFYDWRGRKQQYGWGRKNVRLYKSPPAGFIQ